MTALIGETTVLQLPLLDTILKIAVITLVPVAMGMALNHYLPQLAAQVERGVKWLSLALLGLIIAGLLVQQRENVVGYFAQVGLVTLALNLAAMAMGYLIARLARLRPTDATAITVEVGIQNGTLAIAIALTLLNQPNLAVPAAIYSLIMFATGGAFAWWVAQRGIAKKA